MNGKIVKSNGRKITINGQEFEFRLDMNAMCELEDLYEGDAVADMAKGKLKAARAVLYAGTKASLPEGTTVEDFGSMLDIKNMKQISDAAIDAVLGNLDSGEADDEAGE